MSVFDSGLRLYRKTVKRVRPVHIAIHWAMSHIAFPLAERLTRFYTMSDDPFWFRAELLTGRHETETVAQLDRLIQPGMTFLDIGAHVGYYSRRYAPRIGPAGQVFAFEPHPRTFSVLYRNIARFDHVTPVQVAVAEKDGTAELFDYLMMSASGSLHYDKTIRDLQQATINHNDIAPRIDLPVETFPVRTMPVDAYLADMGIERVGVVKMDIEGAEIGALRGMRQTIARSPGLALVMEYNPHALQAFGHQPVEAVAEVMAMGFKHLHAIETDGSLTDLTGKADRIDRLTAQLMRHLGVINLLLERDAG